MKSRVLSSNVTAPGNRRLFETSSLIRSSQFEHFAAISEVQDDVRVLQRMTEVARSDDVLAELERIGLLLVTDLQLPSAVTRLLGVPVRGSWWAHPQSHAIYGALTRVDEHPDVLSLKLVNGKQTFVHRRLWPAVSAVGQSREPWQMTGLSAAAQELLGQVDAATRIDSKQTARVVRELELRLLVLSESKHTSSGAHGRVLSSWAAWSKAKALDALPSAAAARVELGSAARALGSVQLPWEK